MASQHDQELSILIIMSWTALLWTTVSWHPLILPLKYSDLSHFMSEKKTPWGQGNIVGVYARMLYMRTMKKGNTRANLSLNEQVWRRFRAMCLQKGTDASSVVEQFMRLRIAEQKD